MSIYDKASLVLIPSGTKTSKVYSQKPTNGDGDFTFSRSTAATRVNASGNIEKETGNLLLQSNSFGTTWAIGGTGSIVGGQSDKDGGSDAWLLSKTAAWSYLSQSTTQSGVNTFSVYAKANASSYMLMRVSGGSNPIVYFNLSSGAVSLEVNNIEASIESIGSGWYRCSIVTNVSITDVRIYPAEANTGGAASGSIYIQDAQLEQGLVARDYIETTTTAIYGGITDNVPRLDYTDSSCPALLLEPQRTNIVTNSEYYSAASWQNVGATITDNNTTSPEGKQNATLLVGTAGSAARIQDYFGALSGVHTYSLFIKSTGVATRLNLQTNDVGGATFSVPASGAPTLYAEGTNVGDPFIEDYGSGWYRVGFSFTPSGGGVNNYFQIYPDSSSNVSSIYAFGAQAEAGSYATSYIPTYGSSVSRVADEADCSDNGITSNVGTWYIEFGALNSGSFGSSLYSILINPQSGNQYISFLSNQTQNTLRVRVNDGTSTQYVGPSFSIEEVNKYLIKWDGTTLQFFRNGSQYASVSFTSTQAFSYMNLPNPARAALYPIKQVLCFPTALTDQEAIDLTTI